MVILHTKWFRVVLAAALVGLSGLAHADETTRSYAVMSLVGDSLQIYTLRPEVGARTSGETRHVLSITDTVFDATVLKVASAHITQVEPRTKVTLLMSQDPGLYTQQNAMFEQADAHMSDRDYLLGLLKAQGVSHLFLVTKMRALGSFAATNGTVGTGVREGIGFHIDDTTDLREVKSLNRSSGMLLPFAHIKVRLLDARNLAIVGEGKATASWIVLKPSAEANAMEIWTTLSNDAKIGYINKVLTNAVNTAIAPLLNVPQP